MEIGMVLFPVRRLLTCSRTCVMPFCPQGVALQQNMLIDAGIAPVFIQHIRAANRLLPDVAAEVFLFGVALLIGGNTQAGYAVVTA